MGFSVKNAKFEYVHTPMSWIYGNITEYGGYEKNSDNCRAVCCVQASPKHTLSIILPAGFDVGYCCHNIYNTNPIDYTASTKTPELRQQPFTSNSIENVTLIESVKSVLVKVRRTDGAPFTLDELDGIIVRVTD